MTRRIRCNHGHSLVLPGNANETKEVLCPFCGTITEFTVASETNPNVIDITREASGVANGNSSPSSKQKLSDSISDREFHSASDPSIFVTVDFQASSSDSHRNSAAKSLTGQLQSVLSKFGSNTEKAPANIKFEPPGLTGYSVHESLAGEEWESSIARTDLLDREVALKTLQHTNAHSPRRFKKEFRALADIAAFLEEPKRLTGKNEVAQFSRLFL